MLFVFIKRQLHSLCFFLLPSTVVEREGQNFSQGQKRSDLVIPHHMLVLIFFTIGIYVALRIYLSLCRGWRDDLAVALWRCSFIFPRWPSTSKEHNICKELCSVWNRIIIASLCVNSLIFIEQLICPISRTTNLDFLAKVNSLSSPPDRRWSFF